MIRLDAATVLLQWAGGGLAFLWVTTRRREVGIGYGWLLRSVYLVMALGALAVGLAFDPVPVREAASALTAVAAAVALGVSVVRRRAGVAGQRAQVERRRARVEAMVTAGADHQVVGTSTQPTLTETPREGVGTSIRLTPAESAHVGRIDDSVGLDPAEMHGNRTRGPDRPTTPSDVGVADRHRFDPTVPEFPPSLDLIAPIVALVGLVAAGLAAADGSGAGAAALAVARTVVGAAFLGSVSDAMLLGHWYLVQPGLARGPLLELDRWVGRIWPVEVGLLLVPTGMVSVWSGAIDDGYAGMLGWFWAACAITTIVLVFVTRAALKERSYSAVMAATGLLYLAILTAFGTDLVARAVLADSG